LWILIPVLGYAKAEIRTYEYGRKISDINLTLKKIILEFLLIIVVME